MITIAFTRPERRLAESVELAEKKGFKVLAALSLKIVHGDGADYIAAEKKLRTADTLIFSSATAVEECSVEWTDRFQSLMKGKRVVSIGPGTAASLQTRGIATDIMPSEFSSTGLVELFASDSKSRSVFVIHSDRGSEILVDGLEKSGYEVGELIAYKLQKETNNPEIEKIRIAGKEGKIDVLIFTSPLSAESFAESMGDDLPEIISKTRVAAIGNPTSSKLKSMGIKVDILPEKATFDYLLDAIKNNMKEVNDVVKKGIMIVGHGSRYEYNKKIMELQVDRLHAMGYENIYIGFNETSHPFIAETLEKMADDGIDEIIAIPFFIASGLHMTRDIPPKLRLVDGEKDKEIEVNGKKIMMHFGTPFGDHPMLTRILHERIEELNSKKGKTGIMVIGHGSKLQFNKEIITLNAERLSEMGHENVYYAFNEFNDPKIEPTLDEMVENGVDEIIVLPLFISAGDHLKNDVPAKIRLVDGVFEDSFEQNKKKITVKYALPVGQDPRLTEILAQKIDAYN